MLLLTTIGMIMNGLRIFSMQCCLTVSLSSFPTSLRMLDILERLAGYVNDYKMLLVEARNNNLKLHNVNNRDLFELIHIIFDRMLSKNEAREKAIQYGREHNADKSVVMTLAGITNANIDYNSFDRRSVDMCALFDEIAKESKAER